MQSPVVLWLPMMFLQIQSGEGYLLMRLKALSNMQRKPEKWQYQQKACLQAKSENT